MSYTMQAIELARQRNPAEWEFHQAVNEFLFSVGPVIEGNPKYRKNGVLERMIEPECVLMFRVPWMDDRGQAQVNRGFHVEMPTP